MDYYDVDNLHMRAQGEAAAWKYLDKKQKEELEAREKADRTAFAFAIGCACGAIFIMFLLLMK